MLTPEKVNSIRLLTVHQQIAFRIEFLNAQYRSYGIDCVDTKPERTIMGNSLKVLNPYLDNKVIDFAQSLPLSVKYKRGYGKYLNKKLLYRYIPKEYFDRPKPGSGMPFGELTDEVEPAAKKPAKDSIQKAASAGQGHMSPFTAEKGPAKDLMKGAV